MPANLLFICLTFFGVFCRLNLALQCHVCPNDMFGVKGCTVDEAVLQQCGPSIVDEDGSSNANSVYRCLHTPHRDIFKNAVVRAIAFLQQQRQSSKSSSTGPQQVAEGEAYANCHRLLWKASGELSEVVPRNTRYVFQCDSSDVCRAGNITKWVLDAIIARPECAPIANVFATYRASQLQQTGVLCCDFNGCNGMQYWVPRIGDTIIRQYVANMTKKTTTPSWDDMAAK